ncbi:histidinol-phosphate transaminase [Virgibacillus pantothenticus]|uniref:Histidinol-phosphate aminotransferase n=1 Tax=Virgibacillus pantothenticus TaxID=1473 RepID=A0A0L0QP78_VIRPA|nr:MULTISPECIES: histidinol-phosphate transaminase [Virgibacillus]API90403.1 histidinol-phosphate transaminase [Virgibacillus sp. 6R]KNE20366.1 histidinol-phosphate aminotransferase [Virgibacillus pantothenticus]MBS7429507.1 histidinol-phosphate transaminase [Virgibacillus sp. 19R1-5]MBU8567879.1 histidinol-phosphate transaminase [Virgibacillus pantothenticus]MBU8601672.1 histidinol-phosphate transaminase [Virgibacillus pantothenticus]
MRAKAALKQIAPYQQGKQIQDIKAQYQIERIVKLSSNENPYGYSNEIKQFLASFEPAFDIYPDGYTARLRKDLANKLNVNESEIIFGSGSEEIVQMICRAYLFTGVNTVMATPTFPQYKHNATIEGATVKEIPTVDGSHDLADMLDTIDEDTNVVWLCSPNNPTGTSIAKQDLISFMDNCPEHILVVLDEAYYEYLDEAKDLHAMECIQEYSNLIVLRTFSKAYGLAGLRIGYGVANETIINQLNVVRGPFNTTSIAQQVAQIALTDQAFIKETKRKNLLVKQDFQVFLDQLGWNYFPSETNFMLVMTPTSGTEMFNFLIQYGFIVRPGELLGIPNTIRFTLGLKDDMQRLQELFSLYHKQNS